MPAEKLVKRRILVQLSEDNIALLDEESGKLGVSRSVFLQLIISGFREHIITYREWLERGYVLEHVFEKIQVVQNHPENEEKT